MKKGEQVRKSLQRAEKCLVLGENPHAEMIARQVIKIDPANPEAYYFLGEALCKQGKFRESLDCLTQANKLLPTNPRIIHLLGWVIFMNGDGDLGRKLMKKALERIPDDVQILCDLAVLETGQENGEKAKEYATRAFEIDPSNPLVQEVFQAVISFDKARKKLGKHLN